MTHHIGAANAEIIATNHEKYSKGPKRETNMDLANNRTERTVGRQTKPTLKHWRDVEILQIMESW